MDGYKLIKCGDTGSCGQCRVRDDNMDIKCLVLNALDRCDFYRGPDHQLFLMVNEGGQTRSIQQSVAA